MHTPRLYCLSIAGHDPCGGAGILADIKTFEQNKTYGFGVITAITYQDEEACYGVKWLSYKSIEQQIKPLYKYPVRAVKIGLIQNSETLELVIDTITYYFPRAKIIWDPVLSATKGFEFHNHLRVYESLIDKIDLITPNTMEYRQLGLKKFPHANILLKGGHKLNNKGNDSLITNHLVKNIPGEPMGYEANKHGTGCVLSTAIAAHLAQGKNMEEACQKGKRYVEQFMQSNNSKLGYHA
jgi:hydroxymethylpyrimidine/phosphomethylpyrimidine kinase